MADRSSRESVPVPIEIPRTLADASIEAIGLYVKMAAGLTTEEFQLKREWIFDQLDDAGFIRRCPHCGEWVIR